MKSSHSLKSNLHQCLRMISSAKSLLELIGRVCRICYVIFEFHSTSKGRQNYELFDDRICTAKSPNVPAQVDIDLQEL